MREVSNWMIALWIVFGFIIIYLAYQGILIGWEYK